MYGINSSRNIFANDLTNWKIGEAGVEQEHFQVYIYYKYRPDGSKLFVLCYVYYCVYWYTSVELGELFVDTLYYM